MISADVAPIDDPTEEPTPLVCPGCHAIGDAPCERGCVYEDEAALDTAALDGTLADLWHDEQASSDADPWEDVF